LRFHRINEKIMAFSLVTITTMVIIVSLAYFGLRQVRVHFLEKYAHVAGGAIITMSGAGMIFPGL
jgi:putative Mn2+ efflux pump MntP